MNIAALVAIAAVVSAMFPSPITMAKFKPWADPDKVVRNAFWFSTIVSLGLLVLLGTGIIHLKRRD